MSRHRNPAPRHQRILPTPPAPISFPDHHHHHHHHYHHHLFRYLKTRAAAAGMAPGPPPWSRICASFVVAVGSTAGTAPLFLSKLRLRHCAHDLEPSASHLLAPGTEAWTHLLSPIPHFDNQPSPSRPTLLDDVCEDDSLRSRPLADGFRLRQRDVMPIGPRHDYSQHHHHPPPLPLQLVPP